MCKWSALSVSNKQVGPPPEGSEKTREDMEIEKLDKIIAVALKSDGP